MKNLLFYLEKYGNTSFEDFPLNEVDSLILCQLSYLNLDRYVPSASAVRLPNVFDKKYENDLIFDTFSKRKNRRLIRYIRSSVRFKDVRIGYLRNYLSYDECEQFYAVSFLYRDLLYIVFRGTDLSILGWKENFNMAFLNEIPSQRDAVIYVNEIYNRHRCRLCIAGHSKGGNLALYSTMYCRKEIRLRIERVYNFDGPGLYQDVYSDEEYMTLKHKITTMTTQKAMIAVLLYYVDNLIFIKSRGITILQHDPFNWRVTLEGRLKRTKKNTLQSRIFAKAIRHFFEDTTEHERKRFVDILFTVIEAVPGASVNDLRYRPVRFLWCAVRNYRRLSKEDKKFFKETIKKIRKSFRYVVKNKTYLKF